MPRKRARSPEDEANSGDLKRFQLSKSRGRSQSRLLFNVCFSDEVALNIFSNLSCYDLCSIQLVDSHWARLANDNTLWRSLFFADFPSQRMRGSRGYSTRLIAEIGPLGREIKPMPARSQLKENQVYYLPFKWMYRVSRNWRRGRCSIERPEVDSYPTWAASSSEFSSGRTRQTLILAGDLVIYSRRNSLGDSFLVVRSNSSSRSLAVSGDVVHLTLDQSALDSPFAPGSCVSNLRVACFYADGAFSIFAVPLTPEANASETNRRGPSSACILHATYKHPLLVTLNSDIELSLWRIHDKVGALMEPCETFKAFATFPPFAMSLAPTGNDFKLSVAYCSPIYPSHWLPSAVEFSIGSQGGTFHLKESRRSSRAVASHTWLSEESRREMEREWGQKVASVEFLETDGKFLVVGGQDHQLRLYRFHHRRDFRMTFVTALEGHTSRVKAAKVCDGRCVSVDVEGNLRVWDLEGCWGVSIDSLSTFPVKTIAFDDRRAVAVDRDGTSLAIWRFDV